MFATRPRDNLGLTTLESYLAVQGSGDLERTAPIQLTQELTRAVQGRAASARAIPARELVAPAGRGRSGRGANEAGEVFGVEADLGRLGEQAGRNAPER